MRADAVWLGAWFGSVLVGLPIAAASGLRGYSRPCRVVLGTAAGAFLLSTAMTLSALAGIAWRWPVLLGISMVSAALLRALLSDPSTEESPPRRSPGAGIVLVWLSLGAALLCVVVGGATSIDLLLFWGPKAQAFAAAHTIDVRYLKDPLHAYLHPSYPPLATNLAALATMAARVFPWRLAPITFPIALGGLALGLPGCLRRWRSEREAWALSAVIVSALALLGTETDVGGNADMPLLFFELLAMTLLISPDASRPPIQWMAGLLLGAAASTKVEGLPFALSAAVLFVAVRKEIRPSTGALLRLLSPTAVAVGAWLALGVARNLFVGYRGYGEFGRLYLRSLPAVVNAIGSSLWAAGYGLPFLVPLLVLAVGPMPRRLAMLPLGVLAALSLFFAFTYLHEADPSQWILWSAARIFSPACGLLVLAAAAGGGGSPDGDLLAKALR